MIIELRICCACMSRPSHDFVYYIKLSYPWKAILAMPGVLPSTSKYAYHWAHYNAALLLAVFHW